MTNLTNNVPLQKLTKKVNYDNWNLKMKKAYKGDDRMKQMRLLTLRGELERITWVEIVVNQLYRNGEIDNFENVSGPLRRTGNKRRSGSHLKNNYSKRRERLKTLKAKDDTEYVEDAVLVIEVEDKKKRKNSLVNKIGIEADKIVDMRMKEEIINLLEEDEEEVTLLMKGRCLDNSHRSKEHVEILEEHVENLVDHVDSSVGEPSSLIVWIYSLVELVDNIRGTKTIDMNLGKNRLDTEITKNPIKNKLAIEISKNKSTTVKAKYKSAKEKNKWAKRRANQL
ncbi:hypothetical protein V8G54_009755 [Vigna mungo]|uniref:Uncharacterized protein n=1 Tax=Vigna mungo TaxID=3915 RepID=A0AAQ3S561_VIGMU